MLVWLSPQELKSRRRKATAIQNCCSSTVTSIVHHLGLATEIILVFLKPAYRWLHPVLYHAYGRFYCFEYKGQLGCWHLICVNFPWFTFEVQFEASFYTFKSIPLSVPYSQQARSGVRTPFRFVTRRVEKKEYTLHLKKISQLMGTVKAANSIYNIYPLHFHTKYCRCFELISVSSSVGTHRCVEEVKVDLSQE